jgi:Tfp pilus assembly protein PilW
MIAAHRYNFRRAPLGWTSAMNLFSLMFALLLALAIIVLLLLCFYLMQRQAPPSQAEPAHTAALRARTIEISMW